GLGGSGIGMANVAERLKVLYGDTARMTIDSNEGRGTLVRLRLPLLQSEETTAAAIYEARSGTRRQNSSYWGMILLEQKRAWASLRLALRISRSPSWSFRRSIAYRAMVSTSPTSARKPLLPCSITSGIPPTRVAIGTTSHAIASSAASPNDSSSLGCSMMS